MSFVAKTAGDGSAEVEKRRLNLWKTMEVFLIFLKLGVTSFGGPIAHLGFFQREFVQRRAWISDSAFGDLVAFCQFLPGPASSQVAIALGHLRAGIRGALAAWTGFAMPSAILMIAAGYGFQAIRAESGFLHGLKIAAAAVVAQALWSMGRKFCSDLSRLVLGAIAAGLILAYLPDGCKSRFWRRARYLVGSSCARIRSRRKDPIPMEYPAEPGSPGQLCRYFLCSFWSCPRFRVSLGTIGWSWPTHFTDPAHWSLAADMSFFRCSSPQPSKKGG